MALVLASLSLLGLGIFGPGIANGIVSGGPQLGAGAAVGTGLAAGGVVVAGAGLAAGAAGAATTAIAGVSRSAVAVGSGAVGAFRSGGAAGIAEAGAGPAASPLQRIAGRLGSSGATVEVGRGCKPNWLSRESTRMGAPYETRADNQPWRVCRDPCRQIRRSRWRRWLGRSLRRSKLMSRRSLDRVASAPVRSLQLAAADCAHARETAPDHARLDGAVRKSRSSAKVCCRLQVSLPRLCTRACCRQSAPVVARLS